MLKSVYQWMRYPVTEGVETGQPKSAYEIAQEVADASTGNEPIASFLIKKLKLNPQGLFIIAVVAIASVQGISLLLYMLIPTFSASDLARYLYYWPMLLLFWLVLPAMAAFYPWVMRSPGYLFWGLHEGGVITGSGDRLPKHLVEVLHSVRDGVSDRRWLFAAAALAVAFQIYWIATGVVVGDWASLPYIKADVWLYFALWTPLQTAALYMLFIGGARVMVTIRALFHLFGEAGNGGSSQQNIRVRPWHPDKCGGLGRLSEYALRLSYLIALLGFWLVLNAYISISVYDIRGSMATDSGLWTGILAYVVLAPVVFFLTLGSARRVMGRAKSEHLHRISRQMDTTYLKATDENRTADGAHLADSVGELRLLNELYLMTSRFPVWPFDFSTVRRFVTAWAVPFVPIALSYAIQFLLGLLS